MRQGTEEQLLVQCFENVFTMRKSPNAGPSTPFGAKDAPNFAQDDQLCV